MIVLIDGFSVAFRAFYALPDTLMTSSGTPTNVIHGFLSMINKVIKDYEPDQLIITWDHIPGVFIVRQAGGHDCHFDKLEYKFYENSKNLVVSS